MSIASAFEVHIPAADILQIATWTLAAVCGFQAGYSVWSKEYVKRTEAEGRLLPRIGISISRDGVSEEVDHTDFNTKRVQCVVKGTTKSALMKCQVLLLRVDRLNPDQTTVALMQEPLPCEWSNFEGSEKFGKITIPEGIPQRANLFGILKQACLSG
jgi:hypothetical protein